MNYVHFRVRVQLKQTSTESEGERGRQLLLRVPAFVNAFLSILFTMLSCERYASLYSFALLLSLSMQMKSKPHSILSWRVTQLVVYVVFRILFPSPFCEWWNFIHISCCCWCVVGEWLNRVYCDHRVYINKRHFQRNMCYLRVLYQFDWVSNMCVFVCLYATEYKFWIS